MDAGPIGLVTFLAAWAIGDPRMDTDPRIPIVDVNEKRLVVAKSIGADYCVKNTTDTKVHNLVELYLIYLL